MLGNSYLRISSLNPSKVKKKVKVGVKSPNSSCDLKVSTIFLCLRHAH